MDWSSVTWTARPLPASVPETSLRIGTEARFDGADRADFEADLASH